MTEKASIQLAITDLADGSVQEKLTKELEKVFKNIADPNTNRKAKRTVTLKMAFTPNEKNEVIDLDVSLNTTLAPVKDISTLVIAEEMGGKVFASELKSGAPGQTYFDPDDEELKTDTGTPIEEVEKSSVIDLQQKKG